VSELGWVIGYYLFYEKYDDCDYRYQDIVGGVAESPGALWRVARIFMTPRMKCIIFFQKSKAIFPINKSYEIWQDGKENSQKNIFHYKSIRSFNNKINKKDNDPGEEIQSNFLPGIFKSYLAVETFHVFSVPESVQNKMHGQGKNNYKPGIMHFCSDGGAD
jgi:hypothetical protein